MQAYRKCRCMMRLHHIGYVVRSIEKSVDSYGRSFESRSSSPIVHDPIQRVRVAFLFPGSECGTLIELIEPAHERSPVSRFLARGGGIHHVCYEVADLEGALWSVRSTGAVIVQAPLSATAFGDRRIAWVFTKDGALIEYLEGNPKLLPGLSDGEELTTVSPSELPS